MLLRNDVSTGSVSNANHERQLMTSSSSVLTQRRPSTLNLAAPTLRTRRITRKLLQRHAFWNGTLYRRLYRWDRGWCLYENPLYVDDVMEDCCNNNLTSSKSTDSGCALDFDELCAAAGKWCGVYTRVCKVFSCSDFVKLSIVDCSSMIGARPTI